MLNNQHLSVLIESQAQKYGDRVALKYRDYERKVWKTVSWTVMYTYVKAISRALLELGLEKQERIAVFSQNKPECFYVSFGGYSVSAVTIPIYSTSSSTQVAYIVNDASVRTIFVGEQQQYETAFRALSSCDTLQRIIIFDRKVKKEADDRISIYFDEFLNLGKDRQHDEEIKKRIAEAKFEDMADLLYTSGTTGSPKGVIITYDMYSSAFDGNHTALKFNEEDTMLNFLPLSHIFERAFSYWGLAEGVVLAINLRPNDILKSLQEVRPTCMASVPRFWEKVYQGLLEKIESSHPVQRKLMRNALEFGKDYWEKYGTTGIKPSMSIRLKHKFYDKMFYSVLRKKLGFENGNFFPTAGAAVSAEIEKFVHGVGIYMIVGYGLTESTATVSCDRKDQLVSLSSIGRPVDTVKVKIGENNEILLKGRTITPGYFNDETATKNVIDQEGWFHTGDAGELINGELYLRERLKDLFKTSNGKYIAPQYIEAKLTIDRYIDQCVIIADQRKFVSALIVPDYGLLKQYAIKNGIIFSEIEDLCSNKTIRKFMKERIATLQQDLANYEQVKAFEMLHEAFSIDSGELTNTLKVRRNVVYKRYQDLIDKMYVEAEKSFSNQ